MFVLRTQKKHNETYPQSAERRFRGGLEFFEHLHGVAEEIGFRNIRVLGETERQSVGEVPEFHVHHTATRLQLDFFLINLMTKRCLRISIMCY